VRSSGFFWALVDFPRLSRALGTDADVIWRPDLGPSLGPSRKASACGFRMTVAAPLDATLDVPFDALLDALLDGPSVTLLPHPRMHSLENPRRLRLLGTEKGVQLGARDNSAATNVGMSEQLPRQV